MSDSQAQATEPEKPVEPPPLQHFDERAGQMAAWGDSCHAMELERLASQLADVQAINYSAQEPSDPEGVWTGACGMRVDIADGPNIRAVFVAIEAFDTNVEADEAFEHFSNMQSMQLNDIAMQRSTGSSI